MIKLKTCCFILVFAGLTQLLPGQKSAYIDFDKSVIEHEIDSLEQRLAFLEDRMKNQKSNPVEYYRILHDVQHTRFELQYEQYYLNETLDQAREMIEAKISESIKYSRDQEAEFYRGYKKDLDNRVKMQRAKYQALFEKESKFRKYIEPYFESGKRENLEQALFVLDLAMKYATERRQETAKKYITKYKNQAQASIMDMESEYDLSTLTRKKRKFEKLFEPMLEAKKLEDFKTPGNLVEQCLTYSAIKETKLPPAYFEHQQKILKSRMLDLEQELSIAGIYGDGNSVTKKVQPKNELNDFGIYRFYDKIVVIGKFNPSKEGMNAVNANDERVMKGMAIIEADKLLLNYIKRNVKKLKKEKYRVQHAYFVPYYLNGNYQWFFPINAKGEQQYRVAYTMVFNERMTNKLLREHLKPITFEAENK